MGRSQHIINANIYKKNDSEATSQFCKYAYVTLWLRKEKLNLKQLYVPFLPKNYSVKIPFDVVQQPLIQDP